MESTWAIKLHIYNVWAMLANQSPLFSFIDSNRFLTLCSSQRNHIFLLLFHHIHTVMVFVIQKYPSRGNSYIIFIRLFNTTLRVRYDTRLNLWLCRRTHFVQTLFPEASSRSKINRIYNKWNFILRCRLWWVHFLLQRALNCSGHFVYRCDGMGKSSLWMDIQYKGSMKNVFNELRELDCFPKNFNVVIILLILNKQLTNQTRYYKFYNINPKNKSVSLLVNFFWAKNIEKLKSIS